MTIRVKLMNEYSVAWPLWTVDSLAAEGDLPVSDELAARITAWAAGFEEHFHYERGWDGAGLAEAHAEEGRRLHRALQRELGPDYEVTLDLWEVPGD